MSATVKYGFHGSLYFNSGSYGSPTWNLVSAIKDCQLEATFDDQEATTRQGGGLKEHEPTLLDIVFTGKIRTDEGDTTGYLALETATLSRAILDVMILDGASTVNGSRGYRLDVKNHKFSQAEGVADILYKDFDIKKCISVNPAKTAIVASGTPAFVTLVS